MLVGATVTSTDPTVATIVTGPVAQRERPGTYPPLHLSRVRCQRRRSVPACLLPTLLLNRRTSEVLGAARLLSMDGILTAFADGIAYRMTPGDQQPSAEKNVQ